MSRSLPPAGENRQILEEASAWFVEFRVSECDEGTRSRFAQWLRSSPEHIRAYMEITGVYAHLLSPKSLQASDIESLIARVRSRSSTVIPISELVPPPAAPQSASAAHRWIRKRSTLVTASLVACCLIVLGGIALLMNRALTYETQIGEQRTISLEDGSRIELNARSKVRVAFTKSQRSVDLLEGQAFFRVAKDARRAFVVNSGGAEVRAVGTQFDVYRRDSGTTVTVMEGRVALELESGKAASTVSSTLAAGEQALIAGGTIVKSLHVNVAAVTAWTQGELEFDETPLSEAVVEFNRYSRKRLIITSPALTEVRISGVYSPSDTGSLLLFLRNQPDLRVTETDTEIRIDKK